MRELTATVAKGFCMGSADVIPGVSGGTMAFILGIYERLLVAVRRADARLLRYLVRREFRAAGRHLDLRFLLPLGIGIGSALVFFTRVVSLPMLIRDYPEPIYSFFFGLIVASIIVLLRECDRLDRGDVAWFLAGGGLGVLVTSLVPVSTPETAWFVFVSGAVAISAMLLPGISGAFILLILRKYAYVFDAIGRFDLGVIVPFGLGVVTGLALFSRVLVWLLATFRQRTMVTITGLLLGSLWVIWPFQSRTYEIVRGKPRLVESFPVLPAAIAASIAGAAGLMAFGLLVVLGLRWLAGRRAHAIGAPT